MSLIKYNNYYYVESKNIKVFPCSYRGQYGDQNQKVFDPEARLNTEYNFINSGSLSTAHKSYIVNWDNDILKCVVGGYYFEIANCKPEDFLVDNTVLNLYIKLATIPLTESGTDDPDRKTYILSSVEEPADHYLDIDDGSGNIIFLGLIIVDNLSINDGSLSVIKKTDSGAIKDTSKYLPVIYSGTGHNSIVMGDASGAIGDYAHAEGENTDADGMCSHAEGASAQAKGEASHAEGNATEANGFTSHTEGKETIAYGEASHTEGYKTVTGNSEDSTKGAYAHAEGNKTNALGNYSHAEGNSGTAWLSTFKITEVSDNTTYTTNINHTNLKIGTVLCYNNKYAYITAIPTTKGFSTNVPLDTPEAIIGEKVYVIQGTAFGQSSHAEGFNTTADGICTHAEGISSFAIGNYSHAEGFNTAAIGVQSHAEGDTTEAGKNAHSEGQYTKASGNAAHAEGGNVRVTGSGTQLYNEATGNFSHAEGTHTTAAGESSHAEGVGTTVNTTGIGAHAEGYNTTASGPNSHAEGSSTEAGINAHSEGDSTKADGISSHAEGQYTKASGWASHAEGGNDATTEAINQKYNTASGKYSHAEGSGTAATGESSHAEGNGANAYGNYSHAEGSSTTGDENDTTHAKGTGAHAEGENTQATGNYSHSEGYTTHAFGNYSHAEGRNTIASGEGSHTSGSNTSATADYQTVIGKYNETKANALFIVGNGYIQQQSGQEHRQNALTVYEDGTTDGNFIGTGNFDNITAGNNAIDNKTADLMLKYSTAADFNWEQTSAMFNNELTVAKNEYNYNYIKINNNIILNLSFNLWQPWSGSKFWIRLPIDKLINHILNTSNQNFKTTGIALAIDKWNNGVTSLTNYSPATFVTTGYNISEAISPAAEKNNIFIGVDENPIYFKGASVTAYIKLD